MRSYSLNPKFLSEERIPLKSSIRTGRPLLVGTHLESNGIYACRLDLATGALGEAEIAADAPRPGFLALHPQRPWVYAITAEPRQPNGGVRAWRIAPGDDLLSPLNQQPTGDMGATHLAINPGGTMLLIAHYGGGSTALVPLAPDGALKPVISLVKHVGASAHPTRQTEPHAHGVAIDGGGRFFFIADLGTDEVIVYQIAGGGQLERVSAWKARSGSGPRHLAFHPNGKWLYLINELTSTVSVLAFDSRAGVLSDLQTVTTLPHDFRGEKTAGEIVIHPSGQFVYGSNRGHDSTAVFAVDADRGTLTLVEIEPTGGGHPRSIGVDPTGNFLIAANRDSDNLVSFRIDATTGGLAPTGFETRVPRPVCVVFPTLGASGE